jgi:RNA polymerase sigma factor (TIGR02999 family)
MHDVTRILAAIGQGDRQAAEQLLPLVYNELRQLADQKLAKEKPGQTLQATALVHEAYLRLLGPHGIGLRWEGCGHFFAAAAEAMRRILVENAKRKRRLKRGVGRVRVDLDESCAIEQSPSEDLLILDDALAEFALESPQKAELVKLRYFTGMSLEEAATAMGRATAARYWTYAKTWLYCAMEDARNSRRFFQER